MLKRILSVAVILSLVIGGCSLTDALIVKSVDDAARIMWHGFEAAKEAPDFIFVGSSHVLCDINPDVVSELSGRVSFDLAYSSMPNNGACEAIRKAIDRYPDAQIILECYYVFWSGRRSNPMEEANVTVNWRLLDNMPFGYDKVRTAFRLSSYEKMAESLFPFIRYRDRILDTAYVSGVQEYKSGEIYKDYRYRVEDEYITEHRLNGFRYTTRQMESATPLFRRRISWDSSFDTDPPLSNEGEQCLREIIELCQTSGTALMLIVSPMYEVQLLSTVEYDAYVNALSEIAAEYGIEYYDFNLCKESVFDIQHPNLFFDVGHLNAEGAGVFTRVLWQVLSSEAEEKEAFFHSSYKEKLRTQEPRLYGIIRDVPEDDEASMPDFYRVGTNRMGDEDYEYRISFRETDGEKELPERIVQEYCSGIAFELPAGSRGTLVVEMRHRKQPENVKVYEIVI